MLYERIGMSCFFVFIAGLAIYLMVIAGFPLGLMVLLGGALLSLLFTLLASLWSF